MITFNKKGFTLPQLIVTMLVLLVMAAFVFIWIDPLARVGEAKNTKRTQDVNVIAAALFNYAKENNGLMPVLGTITTDKKVLCATQSGSNLTCDGDSELCLTIDDDDFYKYLVQLPYDPNKSSSDDTGYYLTQDANGILTVGACSPYSSSNSATTTKSLVLQDICSNVNGPAAFAGGHCWYAAASANIDCDAVCAALSLECVRNVRYGPDVDSNGDYFCGLNQAVGGTCSTCTAASTSTPPLWGTACTAQDGAVVCSTAAGSGNYGICPCQ